MPPALTSRERILRTVRGEPVDRVPVMAPIQWSPLWRINGEEPEWTADPNYAAVRELCEQHWWQGDSRVDNRYRSAGAAFRLILSYLNRPD